MARGGYREGSGRKPLALEMNAREMTSPYIPSAIATLAKIMNNEESKETDRISAAKLLISYYFGQPPQSIDHTTKGEAITPMTKVMYQADADAIIQLYENRDNRSDD